MRRCRSPERSGGGGATAAALLAGQSSSDSRSRPGPGASSPAAGRSPSLSSSSSSSSQRRQERRRGILGNKKSKRTINMELQNLENKNKDYDEINNRKTINEENDILRKAIKLLMDKEKEQEKKKDDLESTMEKINKKKENGNEETKNCICHCNKKLKKEISDPMNTELSEEAKLRERIKFYHRNNQELHAKIIQKDEEIRSLKSQIYRLKKQNNYNFSRYASGPTVAPSYTYEYNNRMNNHPQDYNGPEY